MLLWQKTYINLKLFSNLSSFTFGGVVTYLS